MSTRRLAGTRRNKYLPIARQSLEGDWRTASKAFEYGAYVSTAAKYAERYPRASARLMVIAARLSDPAQGSKPDHAARAVDIRTIWPPVPAGNSTAKQRRAAEAGARGKSAAPMSTGRRIAAYERQNGFIADPDHDGPHGRPLTARQWRQAQRMEFRAAA